MKISRYFFGAVLVMTSNWLLTGCASDQSTASASANPSARTYDSQDLARTGKRTSGEALQAADPSVTSIGGH